MSVDNTPTGIVYTVTNGEAGQQYPLTFPYIKDDDVRAYYVHGGTQVTMSLSSGYSVSGQTFTASIALPVGAKLAIYRETDVTQEILWVDGQAVYTPDIMQADDKLTFIVQEIAGDVKRAVKVSREEEAVGSTPGDLLAEIYAARDDAQNASSAAHASETAASQSATDAAASASTAAQIVQTATAKAVNAAKAQAEAAEASAVAAAQSAIEATAAVPKNLVQRVTDVEAAASAVKAITDTVTPTPKANAVPRADGDGKIAAGWLSLDPPYNPQPSMSGTASFAAATNTITMTGIVTALGLEVGDVIAFGGGADTNNKKLRTVESITNSNTIVVNYEHCGNRGNGSLKLSGQSGVSATCTRIAKWYNAPDSLGRAWVKPYRESNVSYTNSTARPFFMLRMSTDNAGAALWVDGMQLAGAVYANGGMNTVSGIIPAGSTYQTTGLMNTWSELR